MTVEAATSSFDVSTIALLAGLMTAAGLCQRVLGFGFALLSLAGLGQIFDIRTANVIASLVAIAPLTLIYVEFRRDLDRSLFTTAVVAAALGLVSGLVLFENLDEGWLVRGTGVIILLIAVETLLHRDAGRPPTSASSHARLWSGVAGYVSGLLGGAVGIPGPPIVAFASRQTWSPDEFRSFVGSFFLCIAGIKAVGLSGRGWVDADIVRWTLVGVPFALLGFVLGRVVSRHLRAEHFRVVVLVFLGVSAVGMIVR